MARLMAWTTMALLATAMAGCGGGGGGGTDEGGGSAASYDGPIASNDVARGEEVFNQICQACHASGAPQLAGLGWEPAAMRRQIREGEDRMPAIRESRLSNEDMEALLAFMVTNGAVNGGDAAPATGGGEEPTTDEGAGEATDEGGDV